MQQETFKIIETRKSYVADRIAKFNKKCRKLNCPEISVEYGEKSIFYVLKNGMTVDETYFTDHPEARMNIDNVLVYYDATLNYDIPVIEGWELICTFDIYGDEVLISKVPDKTVPVEFQNKNEIHCDHCGYNRNRNHSMLMRKIDTGEYKEVGSTCIKDFFGHNPLGFMFLATFDFKSMVKEFSDYDISGGGRFGYDMKQFMTMTAGCIDVFGWKSKSVAYNYGGLATVDYVIDQLNPPKKLPKDWVWVEITDEHKKLADETIEYFKNIDPEGNEYIGNCKKLVNLDYIPTKFTGIAASMVLTYKKHLGEQLNKKYEKKESNWVGEVGERLELKDLEVIYTINVESDFGVSVLYIFVDSDGNKFKTFYSGHSWQAYTKDIVTLKGTVKKHETYKDEKATMLTRCKVIEIKEEEKENESEKS